MAAEKKINIMDVVSATIRNVENAGYSPSFAIVPDPAQYLEDNEFPKLQEAVEKYGNVTLSILRKDGEIIIEPY